MSTDDERELSEMAARGRALWSLLRKQEMPEVTREGVQEYLDGSIGYWRSVRDDDGAGVLPDVAVACYIDAFQSARISLLGEELP